MPSCCYHLLNLFSGWQHQRQRDRLTLSTTTTGRFWDVCCRHVIAATSLLLWVCQEVIQRSSNVRSFDFAPWWSSTTSLSPWREAGKKSAKVKLLLWTEALTTMGRFISLCGSLMWLLLINWLVTGATAQSTKARFSITCTLKVSHVRGPCLCCLVKWTMQECKVCAAKRLSKRRYFSFKP